MERADDRPDTELLVTCAAIANQLPGFTADDTALLVGPPGEFLDVSWAGEPIGTRIRVTAIMPRGPSLAAGDPDEEISVRTGTDPQVIADLIIGRLLPAYRARLRASSPRSPLTPRPSNGIPGAQVYHAEQGYPGIHVTAPVRRRPRTTVHVDFDAEGFADITIRGGPPGLTEAPGTDPRPLHHLTTPSLSRHGALSWIPRRSPCAGTPTCSPRSRTCSATTPPTQSSSSA